MTLHSTAPSVPPVAPLPEPPSGPSPTTTDEIRATRLAKSYGTHTVLADISFVAAPGHRLGVVGENGAGKSTLLAIVSGVLEADLGDVRAPAGTGHLHQEFPFGPDTPLAIVMAAAVEPARVLERELGAAAQALADGDPGASARYADALAAAELADVWDADRRAGAVATGLGLAHLDHERTVGSLSGGERTRLELATILIAHPPALVLDEPTNHLDDEAIDFLAAYLLAFPGPVVVASHDRRFLDDVCTGILDLDPGRDGVHVYGGSFERYLEQRTKERARWVQQWAAEQDELAALRHAVTNIAPKVSHFAPRPDNDKMQYDYKGGRVHSQISRRIRNTRERLESLAERQVAKPPAVLRFEAPTPPPRRTDHDSLISAIGVTVRDRLLPVDLAVDSETRLLVTGPNGAGKSTLLAVLSRHLGADGGTLTWRKGLRVGYLPQDVAFPDPSRSAASLFADVSGESTLTDLGLLTGRDLGRPIGELSVGQRRRVALGCIVAARPHVLLMDEPTNHLSLTLAEELEDALMVTLGAVVVASHDRWLRRRWTGDEMRMTPARQEAAS